MPLTRSPNGIPQWDDLYIYIDFMSSLGKSHHMLQKNGLLLEWIFSRQNEITGTIYLIPLYSDSIGSPLTYTQFNLQGNIATQLENFRQDLEENIPKNVVTSREIPEIMINNQNLQTTENLPTKEINQIKDDNEDDEDEDEDDEDLIDKTDLKLDKMVEPVKNDKKVFFSDSVGKNNEETDYETDDD